MPYDREFWDATKAHRETLTPDQRKIEALESIADSMTLIEDALQRLADNVTDLVPSS